jgi:class 3 adenylate cyclase
MAIITVFLADDSLIVREGVRALLALEDDLEIVGVADDYDSLIEGAEACNANVVVTDIRMPPDFRREGIEAAKQVRKRHPGTGIVILSQYDDPEYAVSLLSEGAAGYAYLLKDRIGEGDQLARAIREVASGGSMLDPVIVQALVAPVDSPDLTPDEQALLSDIASGRTIKAIANARRTTAADVDARVEKMWHRLAENVTAGSAKALEQLRLLHRAIVTREEQGETLSRLLPGGLAEHLRAQGRRPGETERLTVTVLMSDIRGYTSIAENADPSVLAGQLNEHREAMNRAILGAGGTVMQYVGDAVMAVFGAPEPTEDHARRSVDAARAMHAAQSALDERWATRSLEPFGIGIGLSTGDVAAALLGSEERLEYSLVGDTVNLAQRLQQFAAAGQTVLSDATLAALDPAPTVESFPPTLVKGRQTPVVAHVLAD